VLHRPLNLIQSFFPSFIFLPFCVFLILLYVILFHIQPSFCIYLILWSLISFRYLALAWHSLISHTLCCLRNYLSKSVSKNFVGMWGEIFKGTGPFFWGVKWSGRAADHYLKRRLWMCLVITPLLTSSWFCSWLCTGETVLIRKGCFSMCTYLP